MTIKKHIPNALTSINLLCGLLGVLASFNGRPDAAFLFMIAASAFDFCDGFSARALGSYSEIGKELDSLADEVSFGVLPAVMLHNAMLDLGCGRWWSYIPLVLAVMSAIRLAKFNVDPRQHESFIGLATPASAMICGSLCSFIYSSPASLLAQWCSHDWVMPLLAIVLSVLLVSEIPMFAMKFSKGKKADPATVRKRIAFFVCAAVFTLVALSAGVHWPVVVMLSFLAYIVINFF